MKRKKMFVIFILMILILAGCNPPKQEKVELTISSAASLKDCMQKIKKSFEREHRNIHLSLNFGGSGTLQRQILQGAPTDLFISAGKEQLKPLRDKGFIKKETNLAGNELVLVVPNDANQVADHLEDLAAVHIKRIAIGTPGAVPAGTYAKEALQSVHIWDKIEPKMIYAKDVRQVLAYVETKNVDAGIVYRTDAKKSKKVKISAAIDPKTHSRIVYPMAMMKRTKHADETETFYQFLQGEKAMSILKKFGFQQVN
ncbi:molybdate ABC transporter substrate-binding protein [Aeribacillus sp. FSL K6-2848]|uniref:molybdate ABC transporter substrate-binding protein n=1 Tax=Aeribacillus sp. FSL K6-2848 TaxID=2954612 RepID=UPI0030FBD3CC